jgi:prepilin-type processing-associated H-X9-DG protein
MNGQRKLAAPYLAVMGGFTSLHPGGCNFAFYDGSIRFIKDTILTAPYDTSSGLPLDPRQIGVYQALSTPSGGEVVSAGSY